MSGERRSWKRWASDFDLRSARHQSPATNGKFDPGHYETPVHVVLMEEGCPEEDWLYCGARVKDRGWPEDEAVIVTHPFENKGRWEVVVRDGKGVVYHTDVRNLRPIPTTSRITLSREDLEEGAVTGFRAWKSGDQKTRLADEVWKAIAERATSMKVVEG